MSATPQVLPARGTFQPRYVLPNELPLFGLPDVNRQPAILSLVDAASTLIDQYCGRTDGTGTGSLSYTTYVERILMQALSRNIARLTFKPLVAIPANVMANYQASANYIPPNPKNPLLNVNYFYSGFQANTLGINGVPFSSITPILGCSGRYSYGRRSEAAIYPDFNYGANILQIAAFFGGPPNWTPVDLTQSDFDISTGEIWIPAGLYLANYKEIVVQYNSGFDPLNMPRPIKHACAMLIRNFLSRGGGTTGLRSMMLTGGANVSFTEDLIDSTVENMLDPFKVLMAY